MIQEAIRKLREQQSKVRERSPQWMVAQQLMDLCRAEPACAEVLAFEELWLGWVRSGAHRDQRGKPVVQAVRQEARTA